MKYAWLVVISGGLGLLALAQGIRTLIRKEWQHKGRLYKGKQARYTGLLAIVTGMFLIALAAVVFSLGQ